MSRLTLPAQNRCWGHSCSLQGSALQLQHLSVKESVGSGEAQAYHTKLMLQWARLRLPAQSRCCGRRCICWAVQCKSRAASSQRSLWTVGRHRITTNLLLRPPPQPAGQCSAPPGS